MNIDKLVKIAIHDHKEVIEYTQNAIISGIASLIYSEYIRNMVHKTSPVEIIFVPSIKSVSDLLKPESELMKRLSKNLIDDMAHHPIIKKYLDIPEMIMFLDETIEIMKTIFDIYIIPNIYRYIPQTIAKKFRLDDDTQQLFRESWEIDLFDGKPINDNQIKFITEESVLQLIMMIDTIYKEGQIFEQNVNIVFSDDEILTIHNENEICPIHFNSNIIKNKSVIDLLSFVTNSEFKIKSIDDNMNINTIYCVTTGPSNHVSLTKLLDNE